MSQISDIVNAFFAAYEQHINASMPEEIAAQYGDSFMFAGPHGSQAVRKEDFLKVLPKREGFFKSIGLSSTTVLAVATTPLADNYLLAKVTWQMRFEKEGAQPILDENLATYILQQQEDGLKIVFQLDHQDLMQRVAELGLLPASSTQSHE